ncbi:16S rRNA (guanine(966)-N(2))-methyltransferase RsmD [Brachyspira hyodysenteriae]|uniref:N6-adenine-specific methylase n=2 Tax=Brachyspira hyodysenteriae TaxID=159 RepID=A0A3B6VBC9_BRAHW|nr:16S rRNA (guanine(966)-N(2))-methyltransferase RsmD [Brachyspira hyodysenteriae]ACN84540.1 N6-adenine-specific methylase [Brachyspira hyodysenteriae WA1]ANN63383.1 16S rRNA (guanine(966)-N(2))-methyltransferase RsmD [Brachyspira hyodysenteriae ATCC 27164]KLI13799.1 N-6 DNA methylase [Brachyspira hyodysenteriae]KLI14481.1 N-6 DNA methylase [Brachyspira hyodysenteriae]KLI19804.1 N-6 DNA methylase [Brachyspira hyodysenteriae]
MHIISGNKKGRKIITPKRDFRPTQGKVKEAFFNIIDIENKTFLDLCSGSGAMGFEALSRNAKFAAFIEIDREAIKTIFSNAKAIFNDNENIYKIKRVSAEDYVKKTNDKFDVIYLDPPYHSKIYFDVINNIIKRNILNDNGVLAAEFGADYYKKFLENEELKNIISGIMEYDIKTYGESVLIIFKYI